MEVLWLKSQGLAHQEHDQRQETEEGHRADHPVARPLPENRQLQPREVLQLHHQQDGEQDPHDREDSVHHDSSNPAIHGVDDAHVSTHELYHREKPLFREATADGTQPDKSSASVT